MNRWPALGHTRDEQIGLSKQRRHVSDENVVLLKIQTEWNLPWSSFAPIALRISVPNANHFVTGGSHHPLAVESKLNMVYCVGMERLGPACCGQLLQIVWKHFNVSIQLNMEFPLRIERKVVLIHINERPKELYLKRIKCAHKIQQKQLHFIFKSKYNVYYALWGTEWMITTGQFEWIWFYDTIEWQEDYRWIMGSEGWARQSSRLLNMRPPVNLASPLTPSSRRCRRRHAARSNCPADPLCWPSRTGHPLLLCRRVDRLPPVWVVPPLSLVPIAPAVLRVRRSFAVPLPPLSLPLASCMRESRIPGDFEHFLLEINV